MASTVATEAAPLYKVVGECLKWCDAFRVRSPSKEAIRTCLRSDALAEAAVRSLYWYLTGNDPAVLTNPVAAKDLAEALFADFVSLRSRLVVGRSADRNMVDSELTRNRALLLVNWAASINDPVAETLTNGYLDQFYLPPWDTWLALVPLANRGTETFLLCWVPPWAELRSIDDAIEADAMVRLAWASRRGTEIVVGNWGERWSLL